jgi:hypothetical protein
VLRRPEERVGEAERRFHVSLAATGRRRDLDGLLG